MDARLISAAEALLRRAGFLGPKATVLVALSGGADSVALLLTAVELRKTNGLTVRAAHVEHGLRGESSLADAAFCQALCERLSVPYTCDHAALAGGMAAPGAEAAARDARYRLLIARAKECGADALLLAHHQDDQAETVLLHLLRGSGTNGLGGMHELTVRDGVPLCRPFLGLSKQTLIGALDGQPYRTDESNLEPVSLRNRLRQTVLPLLTAENPSAIPHIAQTARLLRLDEDCLQMQAGRLLRKALTDTPPYFCLRRSALKRADTALKLRVLRAFTELGLQVLGQTPDEETLSADDTFSLLALLDAPQSAGVNLPGALRAVSTERFLHLTRMEGGKPLRPAPPLPPRPLPAEREALTFGAITLTMLPHAPGGACPDGKRTVALPRNLAQEAVVRYPKPGDRIRPFGAAGAKPLRRYLTDQKLDPPFRSTLPVVAAGRDILWAVGVGAAECTRAGGEPSVWLSMQGNLPWFHLS